MTKFLQDLLFKGALTVDGVVTLSTLNGVSNRMVVANAAGVLSTQAIPTVALTDTLDSVTDRGNITTNAITVGGLTSTGITLTSNGNLTTTNQFYALASNYTDGIFVGYDSSAVFLGYKLGSTPIHLGTSGTGNLLIRTSGNTIIENGKLLIGTSTDSGYTADINGSVRANISGYHVNNGTVTAPVITFNGSNKVQLDPQGYGAGTGASLSVNGYVYSVNSVVSAEYSMVKGGSTAVNTPFISYGIGRPDSQYSLTPLAGLGGYYAGTAWYNGAGLSFFTSDGADISGGSFLTEKMRLAPNGVFSVFNLAGTGTRMVVADATGQLSVQTVPTLSLTDTLDSVTDRGAITTNAITVGGLTVATPSGGAGILFNSTAGGGSQWSIQSFSSVNTIPNGIGFYNPVSETTPIIITPTKLQVKNSLQLIWGFDDAEYADVGIPNAGIAWEAANTLKVTNGSTGYGSVKLSNLIATGYLQVGDLAEIGTYDSGSGGNNLNSYLSLEGHNNDGYGDGVVLKYSRGTKASPTSVQTGDMLGGFYFKTYSNSLYANQSYIEAQVTGMGLFAKTNLMFATANGGNQGGFIWMTLNEDGKLIVASPTQFTDQGNYKFQVNGNSYIAGTALLTGLSGTGTRMVVADSTGTLSTQAIGSGSLQGVLDSDKVTSGSLSIGTTIVKSVSATTYSGVFFDYVVKNTTNVRVGSVVAISNGTNVEFYETLSNDIGTTTELTFTVTLGSGNINLNAVAAATGWTVIVSTRAI